MSQRLRVRPPSQWFVAVQTVRSRRTGHRVELVPTSVQHAKAMGTTRTVCGQQTASWHKLWERRFEPRALDACRQCAAELERRAVGT